MVVGMEKKETQLDVRDIWGIRYGKWLNEKWKVIGESDLKRSGLCYWLYVNFISMSNIIVTLSMLGAVKDTEKSNIYGPLVYPGDNIHLIMDHTSLELKKMSRLEILDWKK